MNQRLEIKAQLAVTDEGEITGLAWPFGTPDRVGDVIEKGAFSSTPTLPMLFAHDQGQVIGVWEEITESDEGLTVKGRLLVDDVVRAREVRAMIQKKAVSGLSIGFETKASAPRAKGRTITKLALHEISVVAVPCHPGARVTSLKSDDTTVPTGDTMEHENQVPANSVPGIDTKAFDELKARLDKMEAKANRPHAPAIILNGNEQNIERKAFEAFLRRGVERISADEVKALTVSVDANGGYLAPDEFGSEMLKALVEFSPIRAYAKVVSISGADITYPRRLTGTTATWVTEIAARSASAPTFAQVKLTPHELATYTDVSTKLLEDNVYNLEGELIADFAESFGKAEGAAFVKGTGTDQPTGIMVAAGITEVKTGHATAFPTSNPADVIIGVYHSLPAVFAQNGAWLMNRNTLGVVRKWKDGQGRYLLADPIAANAPSTLLGRPVIEMIDMDDLGADKFPILFGDMSGYRITDRVGLSTLRDPFSLATVGQVRFHARKRVGGDLTHPDRFVKVKCAV